MSDRPHRPWLLWPLVPLMLAGSAVGVYMARHHEVEAYGGEAYQAEVLVGCAEAQGVSCDIVNTSAWSEILGVPTFAWAVPTYLLVGALAYFSARGWHRLKPLIAVVGVATTLFSAWLYYVSVYELGYVCLWCMRLYGVNAAILLVGLFSGWTRRDLPTPREVGFAAFLFVFLALITVGGQRWFRAGLLMGAPEVAALAPEVAPAEAEDDPLGAAPALAFDVTTEDGKPSRITIQPDDAWKGNPEAQVAIVEFADFQCGFCKRTGFELRRAFEAYKDQVVFVYKHFPMDPACNPSVNNPLHRYACHAHAASVCAQEQGRFWAYHDLLYKNQHQLNDDSLLAYAEAVGLRIPVFEDCMRSGRAQDKVKRAAAEGGAIDTHGTPRVWIDGKLFRAGTSAEQLAGAIEAALARKGLKSEGARPALGTDEGLPTVVPADVALTQAIPGLAGVHIDSFEAALEGGKAVSGKHLVPATRMSWFAAKDACEAAGKRMCTEAEWVAACQGAAPVDDDGDGELADDMIEGNAYPYGDFHEGGTCWDNRVRPGPTGEPWRPVYTGEMPGCVTAAGVYDLVGNVEEWVGNSPETAVLLGGAFDTPDDHARCYRRNDTFGAGYANVRTGFRCCSGPP